MSSGLKLWNDQGQLRLDTSDRILKYISNTIYSTSTSNADGWVFEGLIKVNDTTQNNELFTYSAYDLDISQYLKPNSNIIGFVSEVYQRAAGSIYGAPVWYTGTVFGGFTIQNLNSLRIYAGAGCATIIDRGAGSSLFTFKLTLYEY